jgi:glycosyltransferase involved in cell wall biosynthesis
MRIMFMSALYLPFMGGLEVLTAQLLSEFQSRGHDVALLTSKGDRDLPDFEIVGGIPVRRTDSHRAIQARDGAAILRVQRDIWQYVKEFEPDVLHAHDAAVSLWLYLRLIRDRPHAPIVLTLHNVMSRQYADNAQGLPGLMTLIREADWITGVSEDVVSDVLALDPSVAERITIIRNGVVAPALAPTPVPEGPAHFVAVGRLVPQKGFDRAIAAVAELAPRHADVRLTIVGVGPLLSALEDQANELGVADRIEFAGAVDHDDIPALMDDAIALVMPSRYEGLPLVALEAAWMARPVVGTVAPGLSQAVVDGDNGLLVDPADPHALAAALESLVLDRHLARKLGAAARRRAEREWSLSACADGYEALYRRLGAR